MQTDMDMYTEMDMDIGVKVCIYRSLRPSRSVKQHGFLASKVTGYEPGCRNHLHLFYKLYFYFTIFESLRKPNPHDYPWQHPHKQD